METRLVQEIEGQETCIEKITYFQMLALVQLCTYGKLFLKGKRLLKHILAKCRSYDRNKT